MNSDARNLTAISSPLGEKSDDEIGHLRTPYRTAVPVPVFEEKVGDTEPAPSSQALRLPLVITLAGAAFLNV